MKSIGILIFETAIAGLIVWAGLCDKKIFFIGSPRAAVIILGIIGVLLCTMSVGKFISLAPAHPLTIAGYIVGTVAMFTFITQIFQWNIPFINDPKTALFVLAACIVLKSIIARLGYFIMNIQ